MAKSSVALRSSPRQATPVSRPKVADAKSRTTSAAPSSAPHALTEVELEVIWRTFKRTRDENLRNTLIEHHMPLVRSIAERVLQDGDVLAIWPPVAGG